jgi:hypothetical protein
MDTRTLQQQFPGHFFSSKTMTAYRERETIDFIGWSLRPCYVAAKNCAGSFSRGGCQRPYPEWSEQRGRTNSTGIHGSVV